MDPQSNPVSDTAAPAAADAEASQKTQATVLLSEIPDAAAFTHAEPVASASADPNLSSAALAALGQRYDILSEAGRGAMGNVYKARDRETREIVALKLVKPELASDRAMMERFKNELLFARKITHKSVCRVYDFNRIGGVAYTSMEFVQGESLRSVLNRFGGLPLRKAIDLVLQVCSGLKEAHAQGIVHRDLKPENVMIDSLGNVKIMDFGIARSMESASRLTGAMMGTPAYMAPEQVSGKPVDYRTDIYSLGLVLYEIFTGKQAFTAENPVAVAMKQMQETPAPPHEIEPTIPVSIERAILKCLEKDPAKRFQSIADLETALTSSGTRAVLASSAAVATALSNRTAIPPSQALLASANVRPAASSKATSPLLWVLFGASLVIAAGAAGHWMAVNRAVRNLPPPSRLPAPVPPQFALDKPPITRLASKPQPAPAPEATPAREAATQSAAPVNRDEASPSLASSAAVSSPLAAPAPSQTAPVASLSPALNRTSRSSNQDASANPNSSGSTYLWIGRFEQQNRAQETGKRIEGLGLPSVIVPRRSPNGEFFVVLSGPFGPQKVSDARQQLESQGFNNIRPIKNLILEQKLIP